MSLFSPKQNQVQRYNAIRTTAAILGLPLPIIFGQGRVAGKLIWYGDLIVTKAKNAHGGKGLSKGDSQYVYTASIIAALAEGQITNLLNVWDSTGRFILFGSNEIFTVGTGGGSGGTQYTPVNASVFGNDQGVARQQSYSVGPFTDYGSPGPVTLSGTQGVPMSIRVLQPDYDGSEIATLSSLELCRTVRRICLLAATKAAATAAGQTNSAN